MKTNYQEAKIYVGTYGKYNNGSIEGEWLTLSDYSNKDEFYEACAELHSDEQDPEFMFQDWEEIAESYISESWISEKFFEIRDELESNGLNEEAFDVWLDNGSYSLKNHDVSCLIEQFQEAYVGDYDSERAYAEELFDECYAHNIPESIRSYIDYESFSRDIFMGDYWYSDGFVFRSC